MSGPKVVRVITIEEKIEISKRHLARLDAAIKTWEIQCQAHHLASLDEMKETHKRKKNIQSLLDEKAFSKLQQSVQSEISFLNDDLSEKLERAAQKKADVKQQHRNLSKSAASMLATLKRKSIVVPDQLASDLTDIQKGWTDKEKAEITLKQALDLIPTDQDYELTEEQKNIAQELAKDEIVEVLDNYMKSQQSDLDIIINNVDRHISELELLAAQEVVLPFQQQAEKLLKESSPQRQKMMADSLLIDLVGAIKEQRNKAELFSTLKVSLSELQKLSSNQTSLIKEAETIVQKQDLNSARDCLNRVQEVISDLIEKQSDQNRRNTILKALTDLGYNVHEGMETAWVKDGNISLQNSSKPQMGVKLSGGKGGGPMQMRPVLFEPTDNPQDAEIAWCSDFKSLKEIISADDTDLTIEVARAIGEVDVEIVNQDVQDRRIDISIRPNLRTFDASDE